MRGPGWKTAVLILLLAEAAAGASVLPGTLARWPGEGVTSCGVDHEEWDPSTVGCVYAIDLLESADSVTLRRVREGRLETLEVRVAPYPYPVQRLTIQDESKVDLSAEDLARVQVEQQRVAALWSSREPRRFTLPLSAPLDPMPEGGRFGSRRFINEQPRSPHTGADYGVPSGTPVRAVADGEVVIAEEHFFGGNSIFLDHGDGLITMYFHLRRMEVKKGDQVSRGGLLGEVGSTGRATGPHLHFGIRWRGARINPGDLYRDPADLPILQ